MSDKSHSPSSGLQLTWDSLLITTQGGLRRVHCPFMVICVIPVQLIEVGDKVQVSQVGETRSHKLVYVISGNLYFHTYFVIVLE